MSRAIVRCELTHLERAPIDLDRARQQHARYEEVLAELGCMIMRLPEEPELPDSVFVEDTAVVLDEIAVITRPGVPTRRAETGSVAETLVRFLPVAAIEEPGLLDGGDVLRVGRELYVGVSSRTNSGGAEALERAVRPYDYSVHRVPVDGCLHLKSAVTLVADSTLLINEAWVGKKCFADVDFIDIDPEEPFAANGLLVGGSVVFPAAYRRTRRRLQRGGISVKSVEVSELAKAEGGVTCCSLLLTLPVRR